MTVLTTISRSGAHAGAVHEDHPAGEVPEPARRRTFTAAYKLKVLAEYEAAEPCRRGEVLRREGLSSSHLVEWRRVRDAGALAGLAATRGRPPADPVERDSISWFTSVTTRGSGARGDGRGADQWRPAGDPRDATPKQICDPLSGGSAMAPPVSSRPARRRMPAPEKSWVARDGQVVTEADAAALAAAFESGDDDDLTAAEPVRVGASRCPAGRAGPAFARACGFGTRPTWCCRPVPRLSTVVSATSPGKRSRAMCILRVVSATRTRACWHGRRGG